MLAPDQVCCSILSEGYLCTEGFVSKLVVYVISLWFCLRFCLKVAWVWFWMFICVLCFTTDILQLLNIYISVRFCLKVICVCHVYVHMWVVFYYSYGTPRAMNNTTGTMHIPTATAMNEILLGQHGQSNYLQTSQHDSTFVQVDMQS